MKATCRAKKRVARIRAERLARLAKKAARVALRASSRLGGARRSKKFMAGIDAFSDWNSIIHPARLIMDLIRHDPPEAGLDVSRPWWVVAGQFVDIPPQFAASPWIPPVLMALAPLGAPPPALDRLEVAVLRLCKQRAAACGDPKRPLGSLETLRVHASPMDRHAPTPLPQEQSDRMIACRRAQPLGGKNAMRMLAAILSPGDISSFDPRRERRRSSKPCPERWREAFQGSAEAMWKGGAGARLPLRPRFDLQSAFVHALADALLEAGAARVQLCPGFFDRHAQALRSPQAFALVDESMEDSIRSSWAIGAAAGKGRGAVGLARSL